MSKEIKFKGKVIICHDSWDEFFNTKNLKALSKIEKKIKAPYIPKPSKALRFCKINLKTIKVVVIGQDPYPQAGKASGRAFEVTGLEYWESKEVNRSLQNIIKLLHKNQLRRKTVAPIKKVRKDIDKGNFKILPPNIFFKNWEKNGVLLLNSALTCKLRDPNSHGEIWRPFILKLISYINKKKPNIKWLLWGSSSQKLAFKVLEKDNNKLRSYHPRLYSQKEDSFFYENHFSKLNINWCGTKK